jgi:TonB family protein
MARITLCLALLAALAAPAAAQTGRVYGSLTDETGAVLPGVEVRASLRDENGETLRTVVTDAKGAYQIDSLTPGQWTVTASLPGFETATLRQAVQNGDAIEWSKTLDIGAIQETVMITTAPTDPPVRAEARPASVPPPPPPPAPAPAGIVRVGGSIKPPRKIVHVAPIYPADMAAQGVGGVVVVRATISTDGTVRDVTMLRSPNESLTQAATNALLGWEFTPTLLNGTPVQTRMTVTFNFQQQGQ